MALLILCGDQTGGVARSAFKFNISLLTFFKTLLDQVPAWQFTAKFKDQDQDTVISFDKVRCRSKRHFYQRQ